MMYEFMKLNDGTEIVHSNSFIVNGKETVKVYFEKPVINGFCSAICYLPNYKWEKIDGFDQKQISYFQEFLESVAHLVIRFARAGGIENA